MGDLISRSALGIGKANPEAFKVPEYAHGWNVAIDIIQKAPAINAYTAHEVAEIIAEILGDPCACNFNSIDDWLPFKCELLDACPNTAGVACWEQYLKFRRERE